MMTASTQAAQFDASLEAHGSGSLTQTAARLSALGLFLFACRSPLNPTHPRAITPPTETSPTIQQTLIVEAPGTVFFRELQGFYEQLLASQHDLDAADAEVLYSNLWDLYD